MQTGTDFNSANLCRMDFAMKHEATSYYVNWNNKIISHVTRIYLTNVYEKQVGL